MKVTVGDTTFDHAVYDDGDVLYLHVGEPQEAYDFEETAEGHGFRFDKDGTVIGLTILNAEWSLEHEGHVQVTRIQHMGIGPLPLETVLREAVRADKFVC